MSRRGGAARVWLAGAAVWSFLAPEPFAAATAVGGGALRRASAHVHAPARPPAAGDGASPVAARTALQRGALRSTHGALNKASHNVSQASVPFDARTDPAVGRVFSLYYSSFSGAKATSVEAYETYAPVPRAGDVWHGGSMLEKPGCNLQLSTQTKYPSDNRKANLRLAELAVCGLLHDRFRELPPCGAAAGEACGLELLVPAPASDEFQEPYIAAAMALAAYSRTCMLSKDSEYDHHLCEVHTSMSAIYAGIAASGTKAVLHGQESPGLLDLKLQDAYLLRLEHVYLAKDSMDAYHKTKFAADLSDVLAWQHAPPKVHFCGDLACLVAAFLPGAH